MKPRLEVELAFVLGADLHGPDLRVHDVLRATEYVVPALEVIDYRTEVPRAITDTIADNAAAAAMVVGGRTVRPMDSISGGWPRRWREMPYPWIRWQGRPTRRCRTPSASGPRPRRPGGAVRRGTGNRVRRSTR